MKTEEDLIRLMADEVAQNAYSDFMESVGHITKHCESPIEGVLAMAWQARPIENIAFMVGSNPWDADMLRAHSWTGTTDWTGSIQPQVAIGIYRADFYLQAFEIDTWANPGKIKSQWLRLIIECDGHEFHERTKEQARRDKRRDRWFQTHGITVLRFTGAEIWEDPLGCIDQVHDAFSEAWKRFKHG